MTKTKEEESSPGAPWKSLHRREREKEMKSGIMEVHLVGARGLKNEEFFGGGIDPYVVMQYRSQEHKSSVAQGQGSRPEWNEKFTFRVEYGGGGSDVYKLVLKLMDNDTFSADDFLGHTTIYLSDLFELGLEKGSADLQPRKYSVVSPTQCYCGELQVGITFTPKDVVEDEVADFGGWKDSKDY